ncbi:MAG: hypothetical protein WDN48_18515 [Pseudolabrys sp.]
MLQAATWLIDVLEQLTPMLVIDRIDGLWFIRCGAYYHLFQ